MEVEHQIQGDPLVAPVEPMTVRLSGRPADVRVARLLARDFARSVGAEGQRAGLASILVSELATNAVIHARTSFTIALAVSDDGAALQVSVADEAADLTAVAPGRGRDQGGHGLLLLDALAARWGVRATAQGKEVWFDFALGRPPRPPSATPMPADAPEVGGAPGAQASNGRARTEPGAASRGDTVSHAPPWGTIDPAPAPAAGPEPSPGDRGASEGRTPVDRGSVQHGPRLDEEMARETEPLTRTASGEGHEREDLLAEPPADGEPTPDAVTAHGDPGDEEIELRSEVARHLRPSAFPADRERLLDIAVDEHAPPAVLDALRALPEGRTMATMGELWETLGGHVEHRPTAEAAQATSFETAAARAEAPEPVFEPTRPPVGREAPRPEPPRPEAPRPEAPRSEALHPEAPTTPAPPGGLTGLARRGAAAVLEQAAGLLDLLAGILRGR